MFENSSLKSKNRCNASMNRHSNTIKQQLFNKTTINLENGKTFTIVADNVSDINKYIEHVKLNGKELNELFVSGDPDKIKAFFENALNQTKNTDELTKLINKRKAQLKKKYQDQFQFDAYS